MPTTATYYRTGSPLPKPATLILAHGAGAGQKHPFMTTFARALSERGLDIVTFDFLYMEQHRRVPDRLPQLIERYRQVIAEARENLKSARERLFIGGKSMGGRAATHVAAEDATLELAGVVLLGYPLHLPGRLDRLRDAHLPDVKRPMLFVQGTRDTFGTPDELRPVLARLAPPPALHIVEGGDHSFKVGAKQGMSQLTVYQDIQATIVDWIEKAG
ncbi:MAG: alpha/beta fold hydrolase [Vicinamibacterales bacterium]|nr:alpha/beta fold hydrolase [Vicinamibacterales bacterium]